MSEYSHDPTERKSQLLNLKLKSDLMYFCYECNDDKIDFKFSDLESSNRKWNFIAIGAECNGLNSSHGDSSKWLVGVSQVARYNIDPNDYCQPYFVDIHLMKLEPTTNGETIKIYTVEEEDILVDVLKKNNKEYFASNIYDAKSEEVLEIMKTFYDLDTPTDISLQLRKINPNSSDAIMRRYSNEIYAFLNLCDSKSYPTNKQLKDDIKNKLSQYFGTTIGKMLGLSEQ